MLIGLKAKLGLTRAMGSQAPFSVLSL